MQKPGTISTTEMMYESLHIFALIFFDSSRESMQNFDYELIMNETTNFTIHEGISKLVQNYFDFFPFPNDDADFLDRHHLS